MRSVRKIAVLISPVLLFACATASPPLPVSTGADPSAVTHNVEGIEHYNMAHWDEAKRHFEAAVKSDPKSAEAHYNMALALDKLGDHAKARGYFKRAGELAPGNTAITQSNAYQIHVNPPKESVTGYGLGSGTAASGKFGY
jgi:Tfp pilus assembly protein PilF